jgi:hypothetical protein
MNGGKWEKSGNFYWGIRFSAVENRVNKTDSLVMANISNTSSTNDIVKVLLDIDLNIRTENSLICMFSAFLRFAVSCGQPLAVCSKQLLDI